MKYYTIKNRETVEDLKKLKETKTRKTHEVDQKKIIYGTVGLGCLFLMKEVFEQKNNNK